MMWSLLLVFPVLVVAMGIWARSGEVSVTDSHCTALDLQLDRQAAVTRDDVVPTSWMPEPRSVSRVAPRVMPSRVGELVAG